MNNLEFDMGNYIFYAGIDLEKSFELFSHPRSENPDYGPCLVQEYLGAMLMTLYLQVDSQRYSWYILDTLWPWN